MKYDKEKITRLLAEMKSSLGLLRELSDMDLESFRSDPHRVASTKYNLMVAIEAIIDICNHIISKNSLKVPEDYADTFIVMAENNLIPADFSETLVKMAKFRNRLVHLYWTVDVDILHSILRNHLEDFTIFTKYLKNLM